MPHLGTSTRRKPRSLQEFVRWPSLVIFISSCVIGLFLPLDILDRFPVLLAFVQDVGIVFPVVGHYAAVSDFPQITALYFSTQLLLGPLAFYWGITYKRDAEKEKLARLAISRIKKIATLIFGTLLGLWGLYWQYLSNPGYEFRIAPINSSRVALAFTGFISAGSGAFMFAAGIYMFFVIHFLASSSPERS
jgi:hypothetical protein